MIVVISLPDATERRAALSACAGRATLSWSYFNARTELGPELSYDPDDAMMTSGRPLRPGELGCDSSDYAAWTMFLDSEQLCVRRHRTKFAERALKPRRRIRLLLDGSTPALASLTEP